MKAIWREEWINEYESPWSILEKLAFVNRASREQILKTLGNNEIKNIKGKYLGKRRGELYNLSGFDSELLKEIFKFDLVKFTAINIQSLISPLKNLSCFQHTWFYSHLRWCKECITYGYHSWLHQFVILIQCPFHAIDLINTCPKCNSDISFSFSSKDLGKPFSCKCGYKLIDFETTLWETWVFKSCIYNPHLITFLNQNENNNNGNYLFLPEAGDIELLTNSLPPQARKCFELNNNLVSQTEMKFPSDFKTKIFKQNKEIILNVNRYITKNLLKKHQKCIMQLGNLLKKEGEVFPEICPYAYAYLNWRKVIFKLDHFYFNELQHYQIHKESSDQEGFKLLTKAFEDEIRTLFQVFIAISGEGKGVNSEALLWIHSRWVYRFSLFFFNKCLKYSQLRLENNRAIQWSEVLKEAKNEFKVSFKYIIDKSKNLLVLELYLKNIEEAKPRYLCPNITVAKKRAISKMKRFMPMNITINSANLELINYVDKFIKIHDY